MIQLEVRSIGVYTKPEKGEIRLHHNMLTLMCGGLKKSKVDGIVMPVHGPALTVSPVGSHCEYEFGVGRENWVAMLDTKDMMAGKTPGTFALKLGKNHVHEYAGHVPVDEARLPYWRNQFIQMGMLLKSPTPSNAFLTQMIALQMLRQFVEAAVQVKDDQSIASQFKSMIDADERCQMRLGQVAQRCGYSLDHLRLLFEEKYKMTPLAYRNKLRLARAMDLIIHSQMLIKQIARQTGFEQVSHFSLAFQRAYGITPTQAVEKYRFGKTGASPQELIKTVDYSSISLEDQCRMEE
jgi:AraC-like DNA-binding protein